MDSPEEGRPPTRGDEEMSKYVCTAMEEDKDRPTLDFPHTKTKITKGPPPHTQIETGVTNQLQNWATPSN